MVDDNKKRKPGRPPGSKNKTALVRLEKPGAAPLVAVCKNPSKSADAIACLRRVQGYFRMQTIARSMADRGPMGGRYMPHAPPIVGRYGKRPHSRMRRLQLRTVHDLIGSPRAFAGRAAPMESARVGLRHARVAHHAMLDTAI